MVQGHCYSRCRISWLRSRAADLLILVQQEFIRAKSGLYLHSVLQTSVDRAKSGLDLHSVLVVEEVGRKRCCKCRGHKVLKISSGENATCNECLAHRKKWAGNNPKKDWKSRGVVTEYGEQHKEEKNTYNQEYNQREVECESCGCKVKKCNWLKLLRTKKHRDGVENGGGGGDMGGEGDGDRGGDELCLLDTN